MKVGSKIYLILIFSFLISSCSLLKLPGKILKAPLNIKRSITKKPNANSNQYEKFIKNLSYEERKKWYIKTYSELAIQQMKKYKIPASIILAQGMVESASGSSNLALKSNNHFGIKCHQEWRGKRVYHDDDEKGECFRKYNSPIESYKDHSEFLTTRGRYSFLFRLPKNNYVEWANGLKKAGYATDPNYPKKLIRTIEENDLWKFDGSKKPMKRKKSKELKDVHTVERGDTLYSISKKYNVSIDKIMKINKLKDNQISIGQEIKYKDKNLTLQNVIY